MNDLRSVTLTATEWYFIKRLVEQELDVTLDTGWYDDGDYSILDNIYTELEKQLG